VTPADSLKVVRDVYAAWESGDRDVVEQLS
jgi:ketosteroid isomerase-like protein